MKEKANPQIGRSAPWLPTLVFSLATSLPCINSAMATSSWDLLEKISPARTPRLASAPNHNSNLASTTANPNDTAPSNRIVGGDVVEERVPFMASIQIKLDNNYVHVCGGTIIGRHKVLTAAHCFDTLPLDVSWRVYYGANNLDDTGNPGTTASTAAVAGLYLHPEYVPGSFLNDVAVVRVNEPLNATPIAIATPTTEPVFDGLATGEVFGWGITEEGGTFLSNALQSVELPFQPQSICQSTFPTNEAVNSGTSFCAGFAQGGLDACLGDSGGPIIAQSAQGPVQVGIVSFGIGCAREDLYGVYSRVSLYSDWLQAHASGVMLETPFNFGWVLPTETYAATGIYPSITQPLRNNNANAVSLSAFELQGLDNAQFRVPSTECAKTLNSNDTCDLSIELLASIPGQYTATVKPIVSARNILTTAQTITAEIPRTLSQAAQETLDTDLDVWYTGDHNPFKAATLTGAVNSRGLRSGNGWGAFSALLGIIEGPGQLSFSYQYVPADGEQAVVELNGQLVQTFNAQTDSWGIVTMNMPAGTNTLSFVIGQIDGEKVDGVLHLDNFQYSGDNDPQNDPSQDGDGQNNQGDGSAQSLFDIILNGGNNNNDNNSDNNSSGNAPVNNGATEGGSASDLFDIILGNAPSDNTSTPNDTTSTKDDLSPGDLYDQILGDNSNDTANDTLNNGNSNNNSGTGGIPDFGDFGEPDGNNTNGGGLGDSISDFFEDSASFVIDNIFNPIKNVIDDFLAQFSNFFNAGS